MKGVRKDAEYVGKESKVVFLGKPTISVVGKAYDAEKLRELKVRRKKHGDERCANRRSC